MARPATVPPARPSRPGGRRPDVGEVLAAWTYVQTLLASLAVVLCGSWQAPPPPLFAEASGALPDTLAAVQADSVLAAVTVDAARATGQRVSEAAVAAWRARATAAQRARSVVHLSDAIRAIVPGAGKTLMIDPETLWLARCMYSESDLPHEQELVAWVVRNRVATGYRGRRTYRDVVLDPAQFSAFNPESGRRWYYGSLMPNSRAHGWRRTLAIAAFVRHAPWSRQPFGVGVRHFYSEISMVGRRAPTWAVGQRPVRPNRAIPVDPFRFRFLALRERGAW